MKKIGYLLILISLSQCAYKPIVDSAGRSGTFDEAKAVEITNDLQHCKRSEERRSVVQWTQSMKHSLESV